MQSLYGEGVTNRLGPESCAGDGNTTGEALAGVRAGLAIELRNRHLSAPIQWNVREGDNGGRVNVSGHRMLRSQAWQDRNSLSVETVVFVPTGFLFGNPVTGRSNIAQIVFGAIVTKEMPCNES